MPDEFDEICKGLVALKAEDFDYRTPGFDGYERLDALTEALMALPHPERGARALFDVMERMPEADLGSPGSLVHTLEKFAGYETELVESMKRTPTPLAIWMVNRILNTAALEKRNFWMDLLRSVAGHSKASERAKDEAEHFLEYQKAR